MPSLTSPVRFIRISRRRESLGKIPEGILLLRDNILTRGNIFGLSPKEKLLKEVPPGKEGEFLLFSGCGYEFLGAARSMMSALRMAERMGVERSARITRAFGRFGINLPGIYAKIRRGRDYRGILRACVRVLEKLGVDFFHLGEEEPCCGAPLYFLGFHRDFAEKARKTAKTLKEKGVRKIIGIVPSCTYTLREIYPRFIPDFDIEVKFILEVIDERMKGGRLPERVRVVYHDPCILSRYMGIRDEPRRILRRIENIELREPSWTKGEYSTCCGGGGGVELIFPALSLLLARRRAEELLKLEPDIILTSCPGCVLQLEDGIGDRRVTDIVEIVDRALGGEDGA